MLKSQRLFSMFDVFDIIDTMLYLGLTAREEIGHTNPRSQVP